MQLCVCWFRGMNWPRVFIFLKQRHSIKEHKNINNTAHIGTIYQKVQNQATKCKTIFHIIHVLSHTGLLTACDQIARPIRKPAFDFIQSAFRSLVAVDCLNIFSLFFQKWNILMYYTIKYFIFICLFVIEFSLIYGRMQIEMFLLREKYMLHNHSRIVQFTHWKWMKLRNNIRCECCCRYVCGSGVFNWTKHLVDM